MAAVGRVSRYERWLPQEDMSAAERRSMQRVAQRRQREVKTAVSVGAARAGAARAASTLPLSASSLKSTLAQPARAGATAIPGRYARPQARRDDASARTFSPSRMPLVPVIMLFLLIVGVVVGPLILNVGALHVNSELTQLEMREDDLTAERAVLSSRVATLEAARRIKGEAEKLGMAPATQVKYLDLGDLSANDATAGTGGTTESVK